MPPLAAVPDVVSDLEKLCLNQWSSVNFGAANFSWDEAVTQIAAHPKATVIDRAKKAGLTWSDADSYRNSRPDIAKAIKPALKQYLRSQGSGGAGSQP